MKVASDLMVAVPKLHYNDFVTKARSVLREDVFRELYVLDDRDHLLGYLDISDALKVTGTKSNVTVEGFVKEAATTSPDAPLGQVAQAIRKYSSSSAAIVDTDGRVLGGVLLSDLFPVLTSRHEIRGRVADVMSRDVVTAAPHDPIPRIYTLITASGFSAFPVVAKRDLIGIVSRRDLLRAGSVRTAVKNAADSTVERIMTTPAVTVSPDETVGAAAALMVRHNISRLPVVEDAHLVGIIDRHDVLNALVIQE
ncbi:CBS domain-containing protein [Methanoculleus sp. FWC-SCC1]|uniref:CBS domain-containing protein n=1 Tax=Methanoculleus frigidifontis TaxID=2584085 RepID=A0ABT8M8A7_9EURY|nr:CBS domain-containing protein [Methanoculleus sp. FWC-SCC1]MDN7024160.1 CBS domain-containing protein [Methanoculleus sp. FWC-SCC1]